MSGESDHSLHAMSYINPRRVTFPAFKIETERYDKVEQELMSYAMPLSRVLEMNSMEHLWTGPRYGFPAIFT